MTGQKTKQDRRIPGRSLRADEYETYSGWQVGTLYRGKTSSASPAPDLNNLPEDPVIRPSLISNGVPRHLWPEGVITLAQADELINKYGAQSNSDDKAN